jgi:hypothetical protein
MPRRLWSVCSSSQATLERKQVSAMLPTLRKYSDGRPALREPSELLACGVQCAVCSVREPANVLCSQFRVTTGSIQRGVAFLGGVADLRTCAAPEAFHIWPYRQYHPFRFRPWNASDQGCQSSCGSAVVYSAYLKPAPSRSDSWLSSFPGQGFKIG